VSFATPPSGNAKQAAPVPHSGAQKRPATPKPRAKGDEIYINQVLNNRFKVESKIGEGGFGAVYRGVQLATGRKVALKLLHPEMTKDENLVARFRREGMVLCNLRDAHTITTYDFDQTPDGTLYIAMELLEGKSLHQIFHEQAPLDWKRVFKILGEMCSSLAEAHAQGIVHRDLKPENIYLENRPGNPEFVKILDFGIAKVMRGDTIDPQSPQLTATGQTLGTLEYMSPEQLMGKPLDGRSDVYALGVVAYEMITGRLPFPDAKGPAGLITAQLKQTPIAPSQANAKAGLPAAADRAILKCLEKDKNNRYPDVSQLSFALQEVVTHSSSVDPGAGFAPSASLSQPAIQRLAPQDLLETRRGEMPNLAPPPMPAVQPQHPHLAPHHQQHNNFAPGQIGSPPPGQINQLRGAHTPAGGTPMMNTPYPLAPLQQQGSGASMMPSAMTPHPHAMQPQYSGAVMPVRKSGGTKKVIWWIVGLLAIGAAVGAVLALLMR
jgi:serine/threonine-protein kinase